MKVSMSPPPNHAQIVEAFGAAALRRAVFTYGDTIHNPQLGHITQNLVVHEEVHERQQKEMGVEAWWERYLIDPAFRLEQETEAYNTQYHSVSGRAQRRNLLPHIVKNLSGPLYGNIINKAKAKELITKS